MTNLVNQVSLLLYKLDTGTLLFDGELEQTEWAVKVVRNAYWRLDRLQAVYGRTHDRRHCEWLDNVLYVQRCLCWLNYELDRMTV